MELVLGANVRAHANDEDISETGGGRDDPDENSQHNVGQQVLKR